MKRTLFAAAIVALTTATVFVLNFNGSGSGTFGTNAAAETSAHGRPGKTMRAFRSDQELKDFFKALAEKQRREYERRRGIVGGADSKAASNAATTASPTAGAPAAKAAKDEDSVTNTQHAGVDEGGIVKLHGEHLVILRRGRLFTVKVGDNSLRSVDAVNAYAPGVNPNSDWYDEMLVAGTTVVVIGYSYGRGGTEINLFDIDSAGGLDYRSPVI